MTLISCMFMHPKLTFWCWYCIYNVSYLFNYMKYYRYRAITSAYYRGAVGALIVYDISRKITFENVEKWLKEVRDHKDQNMVIVLLGNKADQTNLREVQREDAKAFAERENINLFMETSALDKSCVDNAFTKVLTQIYHMDNRRKVEPKGQTKNLGGHEDVGIKRASVGSLFPKIPQTLTC